MKSSLVTQKLVKTALLEPLNSFPDIDGLLIVSGYASSAMGFWHLEEFKKNNKNISIDLIYGMALSDGLSENNHRGFQTLKSEVFPSQFSCAYVCTGGPVHSKVYIWCCHNKPVLAFTGSANYTQMAMLKEHQREILTECNPVEAYDYYKLIQEDTIDCCAENIDEIFKVWLRPKLSKSDGVDEALSATLLHGVVELVEDASSQFYGLSKATVSLLDSRGCVPERSGLNWGQRPEEGRNPNQAYLSIRGDLRKSSFFPERGVYFTVLTDDNQILHCVRAQETGKAIHTPYDNALLGRYFRERLGVRDGAKVVAKDLKRYGRNSVDFYKIDDESFYMNFSPSI